jgi:hypothetical protein
LQKFGFTLDRPTGRILFLADYREPWILVKMYFNNDGLYVIAQSDAASPFEIAKAKDS